MLAAGKRVGVHCLRWHEWCEQIECESPHRFRIFRRANFRNAQEQLAKKESACEELAGSSRCKRLTTGHSIPTPRIGK